jgi:hypothetical protein
MRVNPATPLQIYLSTVAGDAAWEREILARLVIPELERRTAGLGIAVVLVDPLAEPIPGEESWDLDRRFAAIDTCQLFVGILGERYGERPPGLPEGLRARHPWLTDLADRSTAELEIRYALESSRRGLQSFFYLRGADCLANRPDFQESRPEAAARLAVLKDLLRSSKRPEVDSYSCSWNDAEGRVVGLEPFASRVIEDLWATLDIKAQGQGASVDECMPPQDPPLESGGSAMPPPEKQPEKPLPLHEDVRFSVYRPRVIAPLKWYPLVVFAHLDELSSELSAKEREAIREIEDQVREAFAEVPQGYEDDQEDSSLAIPHEAEITFVPEIPGVRFNPPRATFLWLEALHREDFRMQAPATLDGKVARGRLSVFWGRILLAELNLKIQVDSRLPSPAPGAVLEEREDVRPYQNIFASYSHEDTAIVEEFERYVQALGNRYLIDRKTLRAGEIWDDRLRGMIREADVFQLFWSWNSLRSRFVEQEWRYALSLGREKFVRPTFWDDPMPALPEQGLPPEELLRLHFYRFPGTGPPKAKGATSGVDAPALPTSGSTSEAPDATGSVPSPPKASPGRRGRSRKILWAGSAAAAMLVAFLSLPVFLTRKGAMEREPEPNTAILPGSDVSITLGSKVEPGGDIPVEAQSEEFALGEPVIAAVPVEGLPAGTLLRMRWIGPDGSTVAEERQTVPAGPDHLIFRLNSSGARGAYRAQLWVDDKEVAEQGFEVKGSG